MIQNLFDTFIYEPIYNALAILVNTIPGGDVGIAIVLLTVLIKLALFPLSLVAVRTQMVMREIEPELKKLRTTLKEKPEELARATLALFKKHKINPLASIFLILIQLPVIIGLYFVFLREGNGEGFDISILYSFVELPTNVSFNFIGMVDITGPSIVLAVLVAASQYVVSRMMMPPLAPQGDEEKSFQADLMKSMHIQMRYVFPIVMGVIAYVISAAIALYFLVSNLFAIGQEIYVRKTRTVPAER
jgi:YidC/Oxa1 family membrane protein insertase